MKILPKTRWELSKISSFERFAIAVQSNFRYATGSDVCFLGSKRLVQLPITTFISDGPGFEKPDYFRETRVQIS